jgi:hypothetical protein
VAVLNIFVDNWAHVDNANVLIGNISQEHDKRIFFTCQTGIQEIKYLSGLNSL